MLMTNQVACEIADAHWLMGPLALNPFALDKAVPATSDMQPSVSKQLLERELLLGTKHGTGKKESGCNSLSLTRPRTLNSSRLVN